MSNMKTDTEGAIMEQCIKKPIKKSKMHKVQSSKAKIPMMPKNRATHHSISLLV